MRVARAVLFTPVMMNWAEIQTLVRERWPIAKSSPSALLLVLDLDGHKQKVLVEPTANRARPALIVVGEIGSSRIFPPEKALEYNATAEHGALAIARGMMTLRQLIPLDTLTPDDVDGAIRAGALEATRLHRLVARPAVQTEVSRVTFAYMAD
jgi:hypothetical protein